MILDARAEVLIQDDMIAAAWLHDVYEDTRFIPPTLTNQFNAEVDQLVIELTNVFTKEAYPDRNREQRKASEIARLAGISPQAQIIKLCDRIDNLRTIGAKDRGFALLYCDESDALTEVLTVAPDLRAEIFKLTEDFRTNEY
jgi:(p)ppGpp synthase/HD superfamily hydrolase